MSKSGKHASKMARKRAVKAALRSQYAALAGTSKKKKRQGFKTGRTSDKHQHVMPDCGNVGCKRCYPRKQIRVGGGSC